MRVAGKAALEMAEQLDELFAKIRKGIKLLSAEEVDCIASEFTRVKTEKLMLEALELTCPKICWRFRQTW